MSKHSLYLLVILLLLLSLAGCAWRPVKINASLGQKFSLSIGQSAEIMGENLNIKFGEVIEDSRCPRGVTCIWAGKVTSVLDINHAGSLNRMTLTEPGLTDECSQDNYAGYLLTFHLCPYPNAGKKIPMDEYRLNLTVNKSPQLTQIVGSIIADPQSFEGQDITIVGYYRGWDLLHKTNVAPPVTRSDWVVKDATGAIYVSAASPATVPEGLRPSSLEDTGIILEVRGVIHITEQGQPYIEATSIDYPS
jgi:hypothetical protein